MDATLVSKFLSRHFHLTVFVLVVSSIALFNRFMSGAEWVAVSTCAITAFRIGDVFDTYAHTRQNGPDQSGGK